MVKKINVYVNILFLSCLLFFVTAYNAQAQDKKIALVVTVDTAPLIQKIRQHLCMKPIFAHKIVIEAFEALLHDKDSVTLETYAHVDLETLYQILKRPDLDAVFIFGHMGVLNEKIKVFPDHTGEKDLQDAFQGLKEQTKFVGLCGCYSAYFLNDIKKIAPDVIAYGFQNKVRIKGKWQNYLNALLHMWYSQAYSPEIEINKALSGSTPTETQKIQITFTRFCDDFKVDSYDALLLLDVNKNCIGQFPETQPCTAPQYLSVFLEKQAEKPLIARDLNFTCVNGYRVVINNLQKRKPVFGDIQIKSEHTDINGTWTKHAGISRTFFEYHPR